jgi:hypothetical protein
MLVADAQRYVGVHPGALGYFQEGGDLAGVSPQKIEVQASEDERAECEKSSSEGQQPTSCGVAGCLETQGAERSR